MKIALKILFILSLFISISNQQFLASKYNGNYQIVPPDNINFNAKNVTLIVIGRSDISAENYHMLSKQIQNNIQSEWNTWYVLLSSSQTESTIDGIIKTQKQQINSDVYLVGHSMTDGALAAQNYAKANPQGINGLIMIAGFLQRYHRPDIVECMQKSKIQPERSFKYPLGYLQDGVHTCQGGNTISFPVPTLTIGGELDGVVRVTRIAEAFYTQQVLGNQDTQQNHPVIVIEGMNHETLLGQNVLPSSVKNMDLHSEIDQTYLFTQISGLIQSFISKQSLESEIARTKFYLEPIIDAFVNQEGNWFFTGKDEESGTSAWAAQAQIHMASPLPQNFNFSTVRNEFHLLSDEDQIPPYYRSKHRPEVNVNNNLISTTTVSQLRYIEVSVTDTLAGLNGFTIIKEEKTNILNEISDLGDSYLSAIEIGTKLASRQLVYNKTNNLSPESLDEGNRCADINQKAYEWALNQLNEKQMLRFQQFGKPIKMSADAKPFPPAGPWWIWNYLQYNDKNDALELQSYYAFYSLSANPYGAGNHYCKLLSPARALEYLLINGIRRN